MSVFRPFVAAALLAAALLGACGGGGGGSDAPVVSTESFALATAYQNFVQRAATRSFTFSGLADGAAVTGSGTRTETATVAGSFGGAAVWSKSTTMAGSFNVGGSNFPVSVVETDYLDADFALVSNVSDDVYTVVDAKLPIPASVKVGAQADLWAGRYLDNATRSVMQGSFAVSYVVEADTATSVLVKLVLVDRDAGGVTEGTSTLTYRLTTAGELTLLSESTRVDARNVLTATYR